MEKLKAANEQMSEIENCVDQECCEKFEKAELNQVMTAAKKLKQTTDSISNKVNKKATDQNGKLDQKGKKGGHSHKKKDGE